MPNKRSLGKLEAKLARNYCYQNSKVTRKDENGDPQEIVFLGENANVEQYVLAKIQGNRTGLIPEIPRATVLSNHYGEGYFDRSEVVELFSAEVKP